MRGIIIGLSVVCYTVALIITVTAVGVPIPQSPLIPTRTIPTAPEAPPPSPSQPEPKAVDQAKSVPSPPPHAPVVKQASEADTLLQLAQKSEKAGDPKRTEAIYLMLLKNDAYREVAAQRLGKLYFKAGDYRRAEEMYRESARVLRDRKKTAPPLLR